VLPCGDDAVFLGDDTISWTATAWVSTTLHGRQQVAMKVVKTCGVGGVGATWGQQQPQLLVDGEGTNSRHHDAAWLHQRAVVSPWCDARRKAEERCAEQGAGDRCVGAEDTAAATREGGEGAAPWGFITRGWSSKEGQRVSGGGDSWLPWPGVSGGHSTTPG
jgi:hypothetical protein